MTEKKRRYSRAPITEAVIDIRLKSESASLKALSNLESKLPEYGEKKELFSVTGELLIGEDIQASGSRIHNGYMFTSKDNLQIVQCRMDGFTFSRLWPYETWDKLRAEARTFWDIYRSEIQIDEIHRLAVRYINKLELPLPFNDFNEFLRTLPELSSDMSQGLSRYVMQIESPQTDIEAMLLLNQTLLPAKIKEPEKLSVVLDIDLFRLVDFSPNDEDVIWEIFEILHARENQIFEASITDKMREEIL